MENLYIVVLAFISAVILGRIIIPNVLIISMRKRLFDVPDERKVHKRPVPRLGGVTFFPVILFSLCVFTALRLVLGIGPQDLISDLKTFGFLFETMCVRDLRIFADALNGEVYHYRDKEGLECDAVVHLRNGSYGLVEIKLGGDRLIASDIPFTDDMERAPGQNRTLVCA